MSLSIEPMGNGEYRTQCPWAHKHTGPFEYTAVILESSNGHVPTYSCSDPACYSRSISDLLKAEPDAARFCSGMIDVTVVSMGNGKHVDTSTGEVREEVPDDTAGAVQAAKRRENALRRGVEAHEQRNWAHPAERAIITHLIDVEREKIRWLWRGRIPLGKISLIDGDPGLGKSVLTLNIAARMTRGDVMPDGTQSDLDGPADVLLLTAEDGMADTVRPRLDVNGADVGLVHALVGVRRLALGADEEPGRDPPHLKDLAALEEAITRHNCKLVIIDPLMAYLPDGIDAHRDQEIRRVLAPIADLAQRTSAAILVIRHLNKSSTSNALYRGGGSIGIVGAVRSALLVAKDPDDETGATRVLVSQKCNLAAPPPALKYTVEADGKNDPPRIEWHGESAHTAASLLAQPERGEEKTATSDARAFLQELLKPAPMAVKEIQQQARAAGISWRTVGRAKALEGVRSSRAGFSAEAGWLWTLPDRTGEPDACAPKTAKAASVSDGDEIEEGTL